MLDTSSFKQQLSALPKLMARPLLLKKGMSLVATIRRAGVPVHNGVTPLEVIGDADQGVQAVSYRKANGETATVSCDAVAMGYHLRAETQLADLARCEFAFDLASRQWLPKTGEDGRSSVPGVYLAGDGVRILGADGAENAGRLAALAALADCGHTVAEAELVALRKQQLSMERFRQGLLQAFPWPEQQAASLPDEAIVCRCECITAGELRRVVCEMGAVEANRAKAFSRLGMGRCQGRYCGHAGAEVIAAVAAVPIAEVGRLRAQAPVKPLPFNLVEDAS